MLLKTVQGKDVKITKRNIRDMALCIRTLARDILTSAVCRESVFGRNKSDFHNDSGDSSYGTCMRGLTAAFFDTATLLYRLLKPLNEYLSRLTPEAVSEMVTAATKSEAVQASSSIQVMVQAALSSFEGQQFSQLQLTGPCWLRCIDNRSKGGQDMCKEIMNMYAIFVQGPILQFIRRTDIPSLQVLGHKCLLSDPDEALEAIRNPDSIRGDGQTSIVRVSRIIHAGLVTVLHLETTLHLEAPKSMRNALGRVFICSARIASEFCEYYGSPYKTAAPRRLH